MLLRNILLVCVALVIAGVTAMFARNWMANERAVLAAQSQTEQSVPTFDLVKVLVATRDMSPGAFVKPDDLEWVDWPEDGVVDAYIVEENGKVEDFDGAVVRTEIRAGQPIINALVVHPGERGFLAAVLDPGARAVSVPVNATSGISGFVFPGDWVDVLLTYRITSEDGQGNKKTRHISETLLSGVRVLAVDQAVENPESKASVPKTATLEVTPKQAEKVALGMDVGSLSLSLHSLSRVGVDTASAQSEGVEVADASSDTLPIDLSPQAPKAFSSTADQGGSYSIDVDIMSSSNDSRLFPKKSKNRSQSGVLVLRAAETEKSSF